MAGRVGGWRAPVAVPGSLEDLRGPRSGRVRLPLHVYASGSGPRFVFDLDLPEERRAVLALVMENGTLDDVVALVNGDALRQEWPVLWLSEHVRAAWAPLLDASARASA